MQRERVAHRTCAELYNAIDRVFTDNKFCVSNNPTNMFFEYLKWQEMKLQMLRSTTNCFAYFLRISCRQNKNNVVRWLFEGLEQRCFGGLRQHVYFVQDEHPVATRIAESGTLD